MLVKLLPESFNICVFKSTLDVSAENLKGAWLGVGVVERATLAIAFRNQFASTNASSSDVYTGGLKTEDKSFGRCNLLISCSSTLLRVSKRIWFLLNTAEPFFVGGGKFIGIPDTDARLFSIIGFLVDISAFIPIFIDFLVNISAFTSIGFLGDASPFTRVLIPTGFLVDVSAFTSLDVNWILGLTNRTFLSVVWKLGLFWLDPMSWCLTTHSLLQRFGLFNLKLGDRILLGLLLSSLLGAPVGWPIGWLLGLLLRTPVGWPIGWLLGLLLGTPVGWPIG